jgi:hypothetical protein
LSEAEHPPVLGHSEENLATERDAVSVVTGDRRYLVPDRGIKQTILDFFAIKGTQTVRTFDLIRTNNPAPALTGENLEEYLPEIRLCEIKSTKAPIKNTALNVFFFGATETE